MRSVRIEPVLGANGIELLVDVVCECGENGLRNEVTGETSFKHVVLMSAIPRSDMRLVCRCGKKYVVRRQSNHIHVNDEEWATRKPVG